jgi:hypothetical protein
VASSQAFSKRLLQRRPENVRERFLVEIPFHPIGARAVPIAFEVSLEHAPSTRVSALQDTLRSRTMGVFSRAPRGPTRGFQQMSMSRRARITARGGPTGDRFGVESRMDVRWP